MHVNVYKFVVIYLDMLIRTDDIDFFLPVNLAKMNVLTKGKEFIH